MYFLENGHLHCYTVYEKIGVENVEAPAFEQIFEPLDPEVFTETSYSSDASWVWR